MATTTPNFGWPVPTSTDLVKDGATAIEALGDGIDTSMVDLKGGTTGQILAKATNADMDFTWTSPNPGDITAVTAGTGISGGGTSGDVTITNSMATAIDAKGDLIAGTGADAFSRLAVGANGEMLVADSTAATGLDWKTAAEQYPWTAYTSSPANITVGNGTLEARYQQIGKTINFEINFKLGSTSAITGTPTFGLPVNSRIGDYSMIGTTTFGDFGVGNYVGLAVTPFGTYIYLSAINTSGATAFENAAVSATFPFTWTTNDLIYVRGTYEAA